MGCSALPTRSQSQETGSSTTESQSAPAPTNPYPAWSPRFWHGMRAGYWWSLLARNRFRIALSRLPIVFGVSCISPCNDVLAWCQSALFGRRIARTRLEQQPIFILGHWRSGTTLLHELMVTNPEFESPNTFQCFAPWHFLLSEAPMCALGGFLLPKRRPMDNMETGWRLPQEDEFALMNLGVPTPYLRIAFPQDQDPAFDYLTLNDLDASCLNHWSERFLWFLRVLTYHYGGKRLVLKSPTHTGRLAHLAKLFPEAKFIHLTRDPANLFSSTLRLWRSLEDVQALQASKSSQEMEQYVADCLTTMYNGFEKGREQVSPDRIVDIRYEDLARAPLETLEGLYARLELGSFEAAKPTLERRLANHADYQPNRHRVDEAFRQRVYQLWPDYARRYGYLDS